jgi:hypothetical protein
MFFASKNYKHADGVKFWVVSEIFRADVICTKGGLESSTKSNIKQYP